MTVELIDVVDETVSCSSCEACCCRLEVLLITDTGVPRPFVKVDKWGGETMARLNDPAVSHMLGGCDDEMTSMMHCIQDANDICTDC